METNNSASASFWPDSRAGKQVQARLTDDRTLEAIDHLLARIDTLEAAVDQLSMLMRQGPGLVAMAGDMVDETYRKADANGVNIEERLGTALQMAEKLTTPAMAEKLEGLVTISNQLPGLVAMTVDMYDEGMKRAFDNGFDPRTLMETAGAANTALTNAKAEPPAKVGGIFGLLRLIKDPDRQKGLGFLMNFLKHFGRNI